MKTVAIIFGALLALLIAGLVVVRLALGSLVATDEFRTKFNETFEHALHPLLPEALTQIKETQLTGIASLELRDTTLRSRKKIRTALAIPRTRITPSFMSLFGSAPLEFEIDALLEGDGRLMLVADLPKDQLAKATDAVGLSGVVQLAGTLSYVNAVTLMNLFFGDEASPAFRLNKGVVNGKLSLIKPFGTPEAAGHKTGRISVRLENSEWELDGGANRAITMPPINFDMEIRDHEVRFLSPIVLTGRTGHAVLEGRLLLPVHADTEPHWDLKVDVSGEEGFAGSLGKLLKCKHPLEVPAFLVTGAVTAADCKPSGT